MRRSVLFPVVVLVFAAALWWFNRQRPTPPPDTAAVAKATAASPEQQERAERLHLFGQEATAPGVEWRESGLGYHITNPGTPPNPGIGATVRITYVGRLKDGTVFDRADKPSSFLIGATIPGLSAGLQMLGTGGKATFFIPPSLGYGGRKVLGIPANSGLIFDVTVVEIKS